MKAQVLKTTGGIENLELKNIPEPAVKSDEVLVEVKSIGINPVDAFVRMNPAALEQYQKIDKGATDVVIGWDISGQVKEVGHGVKEFKPGDEVFGMVNFPGQGNAYAEIVAAPARHLAQKPGNTSHAAASGATLAALTAWQSLVTFGKLKAGEKVLIYAAAGGVGHFAVQIAKSIGAYVVASASGSNRSLILDLGADEFIDYQTQSPEELVKDADLVLDPLLNDHIIDALKTLKPGGRMISLLDYGTDAFQLKAREKQVSFHRLNVISSGEDMKKIAELLASGKMKTVIAKAFPFEQLGEAHLQVQTGKTHGKVVVTL